MSEQRIDDGGPAFPDSASWPMFPQQVAFRPADGQPEFASHYGGDWATGMTLRQYAAINLKVPNSGTDWLDQMIRESLRDEIASKAMQGWYDDPEEISGFAYFVADAMLIAAAKSVQMAVNQPNDADIMDCSKLCSDEEMLALVEHVLATVREDDDELIDADWLSLLTGYEKDVRGTLVSVKVTEELSLVGDLDCPERWQVWFNEYEIGECIDRDGFRSLCRGLGITLQEPS